MVLTLVLVISLPCFSEVKIFFSPKGGAIEQIIRQIDNAQDYIDIAMYSFTYQPISEAVVRARNRGGKGPYFNGQRTISR
ncbi:hypothetical protein ES703_47428 [subsurface metagenome]